MLMNPVDSFLAMLMNPMGSFLAMLMNLGTRVVSKEFLLTRPGMVIVKVLLVFGFKLGGNLSPKSLFFCSVKNSKTKSQDSTAPL